MIRLGLSHEDGLAHGPHGDERSEGIDARTRRLSIGGASTSTSTIPIRRCAAILLKGRRSRPSGWEFVRRHGHRTAEVREQDDPRRLPALLPRGVRLREDQVRERWVLLAPERVVKAQPHRGGNPEAAATASRSLARIVAGLAEQYNADPTRGRAPTCARCSPACSRNGCSPMSRPLPPPTGMLAELTYRCPLVVPLLLQSAGDVRARSGNVHAGVEEHLFAGGGARRAASASLRRRAGVAPRPAGTGRPLRAGRALQQSHHLRRRPHAKAVRRSRRRRPRPRATVDPGRQNRKARTISAAIAAALRKSWKWRVGWRKAACRSPSTR